MKKLLSHNAPHRKTESSPYCESKTDKEESPYCRIRERVDFETCKKKENRCNEKTNKSHERKFLFLKDYKRFDRRGVGEKRLELFLQLYQSWVLPLHYSPFLDSLGIILYIFPFVKGV